MNKAILGYFTLITCVAGFPAILIGNTTIQLMFGADLSIATGLCSIFVLGTAVASGINNIRGL